MPRASAKRTIEEMANGSDSEDSDYIDAPRARTSKSKARKKTKSKPANKSRRKIPDDYSVSDDESFGELSDVEFPEEEEDLLAEKNARGTTRRSTTKNRITYDEGSPSEESEEEVENTLTPPPKRPRKVVRLKLPNTAQQKVSKDALHSNRPTTRQSRQSPDDMLALTNSGHHIEPVSRATRSPGVEASKPARRSTRSSKPPPDLEKEGEDVQMEQGPPEVVDETTMEVRGSQAEILDSDPQREVDGGDQAADGDEPAENQQEDAFVPESENGDAKGEEVAKNEEPDEEDEDEDEEAPTSGRRRRPRRNQEAEEEGQPDGEETAHPRRSGRKKPPKSSQRKQDEESDFEPEEEDSNDEDDISGSDAAPSPRRESQDREEGNDDASTRRPGLRKRASRSAAQSDADENEALEIAEELEDLGAPVRPRRRLQPQIIYEKPRRSRKDVDYRIIRPDLTLNMDEAENEVTESPSRRGRGGAASWQRTLFPTYGPFGGGGPSAILGPPGALAAAGGADSDSSDDEVMQHPKSAGPASAIPPGAPGFLPPTQTHGADPVQGLSGTPANLGKFKDKQALADADPLGVDMNVNFESVGGLQGHIDQLKEMVSLPLMYPEIFRRFHIVPPRGVLFHGPPGTGKTLLARALANSVSSEGRKVTFYMRKGADALSKWVGEAERQLRLLFDEARKTQPSIIFFDEIDGKLKESLLGTIS